MSSIFGSTKTGSQELDEHLNHVRNFDWSSTELGPIASWPPELLQVAHVMMLEPHPRVLLLGKRNWMLYNPAYAKAVVADKHPEAMGMEQAVAWQGVESAILDATNETRDSGLLPRTIEDYHITLPRNGGSMEELVFSWTLIPLARFTNSDLIGVYVSLSDVTERHVAATRSKILYELETACAAARDMSSLWAVSREFMELHPYSFPFALLYSGSAGPSDTTSNTLVEKIGGTTCRLEGTVGEFEACPRRVLEDCLPVRQALESKEPILINSADEHFPKTWLHAPGRRGYGDAYNSAVICPVYSDAPSNHITGLVVIGLNTRCPYDEAYKNWILQVVQALRDAANNVKLIEEEMKNNHDMTNALAKRDRETTAITGKFERLQRVVQLSDVGVFSFDPNGKLLEANDSWYTYSNFPKPDTGVDSSSIKFMDLVYEEDRKMVSSQWITLAQGTPVTFEMRWKAAPGSEDPPCWVLAACVPLLEDSKLVSISGCTTDISAQKRIQDETVARTDVYNKLLRMQYITEQVTAGIFELLPDGVLIHSNDAYHKLSGVPRAVVGIEQLAFASYLYPDDYDMVIDKWQSMIGGTPTTFEMRWKAPLNEYGEDFAYTLAACMPVKNSYGETTSIYGCITDIGAQKRAEHETRRRAEALERARVSEQRFYRFTQSAPVAIYISDSDMRLTYVNDNWFEMTQHPRVPFAEIEWHKVVHEEDLAHVNQAWEAIFRGEQVNVQFRLKTLQKREDGPAARVWVMATALPEVQDGKLVQVIGTMTDISLQQHKIDEQQLRIDEAVEAKRHTLNFIDTISHEIRNPLSAVVHCADAISDSLTEMQVLVRSLMHSPQQDTAKQLHEYIEGSLDATNTIKSCNTFQRRIVDDILHLSKLDSHLLRIAISPVKALSIVHDVEKLFEQEAIRECINFAAIADPSLDEMGVDWLLLDQGRLTQVLVNLLTNAFKFTKTKDGERNITIRMGAAHHRPSEADLHVNFDVDYTLSQSLRDSIYDTPDFAKERELYLYFSVQDSGKGMTEEEKGRIFARFQQASPRTYSEYGGSGLGLFISHSLVGLQSGEIGVATSLNVGSTFAFFVKTARCAPIAPTALPVRAVKENPKTNGSTDRISVLIVEDNLLNQRVLKKQLSKNYDVFTADHGQEALDFLKTTRHWKSTSSTESKHIDIILMDIEMPVMNGLDCARTIRELQKTGELRDALPIIAVSANARPEQKNQATAAGMDDAIAKPFRILELTPKIDRLVNWARGV